MKNIFASAVLSATLVFSVTIISYSKSIHLPSVNKIVALNAVEPGQNDTAKIKSKVKSMLAKKIPILKVVNDTAQIKKALKFVKGKINTKKDSSKKM